jgi:formamidopyrimidine-DNA glycosylase
MPELPEVEIAARNLRAWALGRRVEGVRVDDRARRIFRPQRPATFRAAVAGARVADVARRGKHLLVRLHPARRGDPPIGLLSHLGMTGKWIRRGPGEAAPSHSRAELRLDDGAVLHYRDPRLFGRLRVVPGARFGDVPELAALGPDPLGDGIDRERLGAALSRRQAPIKVVLLDQALLPGIGNIQASEALFRAGIDPRRPARSPTRAEVSRLVDSILASLHDTIAREEGPEPHYVEEPGSENPFLVYGREGERCPRCRREAIRRIVQAQRSTFYCRRCQR